MGPVWHGATPAVAYRLVTREWNRAMVTDHAA